MDIKTVDTTLKVWQKCELLISLIAMSDLAALDERSFTAGALWFSKRQQSMLS